MVDFRINMALPTFILIDSFVFHLNWKFIQYIFVFWKINDFACLQTVWKIKFYMLVNFQNDSDHDWYRDKDSRFWFIFDQWINDSMFCILAAFEKKFHIFDFWFDLWQWPPKQFLNN